MEPIVTLGICARNEERTIVPCLDSITRQDYPHDRMEIVVVDDGSEDRTLSVVLQLACKSDIPMKIICQEWKGLGAARDAALSSARGEYLIWVDADMRPLGDFVRRQVDFMERNHSVGIARGRYVRQSENLLSSLGGLESLVAYWKYGGRPSAKLPGTGGTICRTKALRQVGGFDNKLTGTGEDQDLAYRVAQAGWLIYFATDAVFYAEDERTLNQLWSKCFWHGFGNFSLYVKNREIIIPYRMTPIAAFMLGLVFSQIAYKLTHRYSSFLLPCLLAFKATAWLAGFVKSQATGSYLYYRRNSR